MIDVVEEIGGFLKNYNKLLIVLRTYPTVLDCEPVSMSGER